MLNGTFPGTSKRTIVLMVMRIGAIVFVLEALIMLSLSGFDPTEQVIREGLVDSSMLTLLSTPFIYWWVAKPFQAAENRLKKSLFDEGNRQAELARQLQSTLERLEVSLASNEELRARLQLLSEQIADHNERSLQRTGADLHDGPAQLLSYAMLRFNRIDELLAAGGVPQASKELKRVRVAIEDTLREVRNLSAGLSLPALKNATLESAVAMAVASHQEHTNSLVAVDVSRNLPMVPDAVKVSIYRFVQEALANAFRHAGGLGQAVKVEGGNELPLKVSVSDAGPGISVRVDPSKGLGLPGMRARIEALGGRFTIERSSAGGTEVIASFCEASLRRRGGSNV